MQAPCSHYGPLLGGWQRWSGGGVLMDVGAGAGCHYSVYRVQRARRFHKMAARHQHGSGLRGASDWRVAFGYKMLNTFICCFVCVCVCVCVCMWNNLMASRSYIEPSCCTGSSRTEKYLHTRNSSVKNICTPTLQIPTLGMGDLTQHWVRRYP